MNQDWLDWTQLNLKRGCDPKEIFLILRQNGFSESDIREAMFPKAEPQKKYIEYVNSKGEPIPFDGIQPSFDYIQSANPRLLRHPNLVKTAVEGIQLYTLDNFLSVGECESLIAQMSNNLRRSTMTGSDSSGHRTSSTCDLQYLNTSVVNSVDNKIAQTLGVDLSWSDSIEGQKYEVGQEFKSHTDYYEPCSMEFKNFAGDLGQRTWTFMVNLNEVEQGGATYFNRIEKTFYPKRGRAIIWNNLNEDGSVNPLTEHQGMPVEVGNKFIITKWFRDRTEGKAKYSLT